MPDPCTVLGVGKKSVEPGLHRPTLYAYEPLPDHTIGGFPRNLVKEKSLSNSWRQARANAVR